MADPTFDPSKPFSVQDAAAPSVTPTTATPAPKFTPPADDPNSPTRIVYNDKGEVQEIRGNPNYQGRTQGQRFRDSYMDSAQNGFGGFIARKILGDGIDGGLLGGTTDQDLMSGFDKPTWIAKMRQQQQQAGNNPSDQQLENMYTTLLGKARETHRGSISGAQRDLRIEGQMKEQQDPSAWYNPAWLGGTLLGSAGPEDLIAPGLKFGKLGKLAPRAAPVVGRMAGAGAVNAASDAFYQGMDLNDGVSNKYSPGRTLFAGLTGAGFQGGLEAAAAGGSKLWKLFRSRTRGTGPDGNPLAGVELPEGFAIETLPDGNARVTDKDGNSFNFSKDYFDGEGAWMVPIINDLNAQGADFRISFNKGNKPVIIQNDRGAIDPFLPEQLRGESANYSRVYDGEETYLVNNNRTSDTRVGEEPVAAPEVEGEPIVVTAPRRGKKGKKPAEEPAAAEPAPVEPVATPVENVDPNAPRVNPDEAAPAPVAEPVAPEVAAQPRVEEPTAPDAAPTAEASAPEADLVTRLTTAINDAGKLSKEQAALRSADLSDKLKASIEARRNGSTGEAGLNAELSALKGESPKPAFEGIRDQFKPDEINSLFDMVRDSPALAHSAFAPINARVGLRKLLDGEIPNKSEIELLGKVFPPDFIKAALKNRSSMAKFGDIAGNALNLPRTMMSTFDLSAPFRQGVFMAGRKEFYQAWPTMFKEFWTAFKKNDEAPVAARGQNWQSSGSAVLDEIRSRPTYDMMERSGLELTEPYSGNLSAREEQFMSKWAEHLPGNNLVSKTYNTTMGRMVRGSEAGFSAFLNKLRADVFDDIYRKSVSAGIDFRANPKALTDIASFVNAATGRGSLGGLNKHAPLLNNVFFSPRLIASRVQMLNPAKYVAPEALGGYSPVVRREAIRSMLQFGALATTIVALAKMGGADVEDDPRSSDFGKIKVGNTRFDIFGGSAQYVTFAARLASNETKTIKGDVKPLDGKGYNGTRKEVIERFFENKLAPVPGYVRDWANNADPVGQPFEARKDAIQLFTPLFLQDLYSVYQDGGLEATPKAIPGFFGVGVQTYQDKPKFDPKALTDAVEDLPAGTPEVAPGFDPKGVSTTEPLPADAAPVEGGFDPNQPFETTTSGNLQAADVLTNMGFHITDEGIRSEADQENYYNNTQGAAAPGHSPHQSGNAIDIRVPKGVKPSDIVAELTARGFKGVTIITKRHGTGPHWHIQWKSAGE